MSNESTVELEEVRDSDLPVKDLEWLNEGVEKLGISLESVLSPGKDLHYSPSRYGPIPSEDEYLAYNVTLYDMRMEDSEALVSWIYSLTHTDNFDPKRMIDEMALLCVFCDITQHLTLLTKAKTSFDKSWVKNIRKKMRFVEDTYFHVCAKLNKESISWGEFQEACKKADEEYLEIARQKTFAGKVSKKRIPVKYEMGWEHLPPSEGKEWVESDE